MDIGGLLLGQAGLGVYERGHLQLTLSCSQGNNKAKSVYRGISKPVHPTMCSHQIIIDITDPVLEFMARIIFSEYSQTMSEIEGEFYKRGIS